MSRKFIILSFLLIIFCVPSLAHADITSNLEAQWTFDETSGTTAADSTSNGHTATLVSFPVDNSQWTASGSRRALTFDGIDDQLTFTGIAFTNNPGYTVSLWLYPIPSSDTDATLLENAIGTTGFFYKGSTKKLDFYSDSADHIGSQVLTESRWHHVVMVVEGTAVTFYVDGVADSPVGGGKGVTFGLIGNDAASENFKGKMDDYRLYGRALSASDVASLYHDTSPDFQAWYKFDEASGLSAADSSGNTNTGTLNSNFPGDSTQWVSGKVGRGLTFRGTNEDVDAGTNLIKTVPYTVCAWIYPQGFGGSSLGRIFDDGGRFFSINNGGGGISSSLSVDFSYYTGNNSISLNAWQHVCITSDFSSHGIFYINGLSAGTGTFGAASSNFIIGNRSDDTRGFNGIIDDMRIYYEDLSASQIADVYNQGLTTPPTVTTSAASSVLTATATLNGSISATGGADATQSGFAYGTVSDLSTIIATSTLGAQTGTASFTQSLSGLTPNTTYYFRAYATNSAGTGQGSILSFTTLPLNPPTVTTQAVSSIAATTATGNGNITVTGNVNSTVRGVVYGTTLSYGGTTVENGSFSTGAFTASITGLTCNTLYHVAAYATNSQGTSYGSDVTFTTSPCVPTLTTSAASSITTSTATLNGSISATGGANATQSGFAYGTDSSLLTVIATSTLGSQTGTASFTQSLTGLTPNTTYYFRAYATNSAGTGQGSVLSFTTSRHHRTLVPDISYRINVPSPSPTTEDTINVVHTPTDDTNATPTPSTAENVTKNIVHTLTYNFGTVPLKKGSAGNSVKELQRFLNKTLNLGLLVDGILGQKTIAGIKDWQKSHGLFADGIVGPKTKLKMNALVQ